jgi:hypothetical protein
MIGSTRWGFGFSGSGSRLRCSATRTRVCLYALSRASRASLHLVREVWCVALHRLGLLDCATGGADRSSRLLASFAKTSFPQICGNRRLHTVTRSVTVRTRLDLPLLSQLGVMLLDLQRQERELPGV